LCAPLLDPMLPITGIKLGGTAATSTGGLAPFTDNRILGVTREHFAVS
jgi:hypothetical protein